MAVAQEALGTEQHTECDSRAQRGADCMAHKGVCTVLFCISLCLQVVLPQTHVRGETANECAAMAFIDGFLELNRLELPSANDQRDLVTRQSTDFSDVMDEEDIPSEVLQAVRYMRQRKTVMQ